MYIEHVHWQDFVLCSGLCAEQNGIDWRKNEEICREAVAAYKRKSAKMEKIDVTVLNKWGCECIDQQIRLLRSKKM